MTSASPELQMDTRNMSKERRRNTSITAFMKGGNVEVLRQDPSLMPTCISIATANLRMRGLRNKTESYKI